jgi:hypothetical protein
MLELRRDRQELIDELVSEFEARNVNRHLVYRGVPRTAWSDSFIARWAAILRLRSYESEMRVAASVAPCTRCVDAPFRVSDTLDDGYVLRCERCGEEWLIFETRGNRSAHPHPLR